MVALTTNQAAGLWVAVLMLGIGLCWWLSARRQKAKPAQPDRPCRCRDTSGHAARYDP